MNGWVLLAQQVPDTIAWGNLIVSLGTGGVAVLFAMKWCQSEVEKRTALLSEHNAYLKQKREEDAQLLQLVLQKGKTS